MPRNVISPTPPHPTPTPTPRNTDVRGKNAQKHAVPMGSASKKARVFRPSLQQRETRRGTMEDKGRQDPREGGHTIQHQGVHLKKALRTPNSTLFEEKKTFSVCIRDCLLKLWRNKRHTPNPTRKHT